MSIWGPSPPGLPNRDQSETLPVPAKYIWGALIAYVVMAGVVMAMHPQRIAVDHGRLPCQDLGLSLFSGKQHRHDNEGEAHQDDSALPLAASGSEDAYPAIVALWLLNSIYTEPPTSW